MADPLNLYYWDACIFYEFLRGEQQDILKARAITKLLDENKSKRNRICTSSLTHLEVFPKKLGEAEERAYWDRFQSLYFFDVEVDRSVISLAREIKNYYYSATGPNGYRMMSTGDAVHLATAIIHGATELHTRDGRRRNGNVPLIGLPEASPNGKVCGHYDLRIIDPKLEQGDFDALWQNASEAVK